MGHFPALAREGVNAWPAPDKGQFRRHTFMCVHLDAVNGREFLSRVRKLGRKRNIARQL